jgi:uncharacterized repeat protein (TIGR01451 family)
LDGANSEPSCHSRGFTVSRRIILVTALMFGCNGLTPTELACSETAACPPGYCCSLTRSFCAADGDPTCAGEIDAGSTDGGAPETDAGPELDAGVDAGSEKDAGSDAGLSDAGADAGIDAGRADAGPGEDAGLDAGLPDAGPGEDAGLPDAGFGEDAGLDAGPMDAGTDAGLRNDAGPDAGMDAGTSVVPPSNLTYATNPAVFTKGQPITNDIPSSTGGAVSSYSISPTALPTGLSFSTATGILAGTPTVVVGETPYTVTATNPAGSTHVTLNITVNDVPPSDLTYAVNPAVYTAGQPIVSDSPSHMGGAVTLYAVSPALPSGLSFSTTTGAVAGTPTMVSAATGYTVTASNSGGSTQVQLDITVVAAAPPTNLTYATNPAVYAKGAPITNNVPSSSGGAVVSYAITPALPSGLSLNTLTGVLSGTPTLLLAETPYTVTATNTGGSTQVVLDITVNDLPPRGLAYEVNPATYNEGQQIAPNAPSYSGGTVTMFAISPDLPAGLGFDLVSGIVSGTPAVMSPSTDYTITATNSGGSAQATLNITVTNIIAPAGLSYSENPAVYTLGAVITNDVPSSTGGAVSSYGISAPLPVGLSFSSSTGVVSGTPMALSAATVYTIGAYNVTGSTSTNLTISVVDVPPSGLSYSASPAVYTLGQAIPNNTPATTGGGPVVSYSITPALPSGLSLNASSGIISGTPTVLSTPTSYTVTATNTGGSTTALISITVNAVAPTGLTYTLNPAVYTKGVAITNNSPSSSGGTIVSYSISPALPSGLSFSTSTGVISGTPGALSTQQGYLVTATNSGGSTTATVTITVNDAAPRTLTYVQNPAVFTKGQTLAGDSPSSAGGTVISYSISPAPPQGLTFSTATGVLGGTPSAITAQANYTVTATNTGGSTTVLLSITVNDVAPSALSYATNPLMATKGVAITSDNPSISGGPVVTWSVSPALPSGLSFSTSSGVVSGTPTAITAQASYTVTATNTGGFTTRALSITVNDVAPSGLSYQPNPAFFTVGTTITNLTPILAGGGAVTSWSISPGLPSGLSFSTSTGVISGEPTAAAATTGYVVTATNSGGSAQATLTITVSAPQITIGINGALAAGQSHACAIVAGGVQCWGDNGYGDLGNNSTAKSTVPVQVSGLSSGAQAVAVGYWHSCALVNGGVECWGYNGDGELGNNSTLNTVVPVQVPALSSGVQAIAANNISNCAIRNGDLLCWGFNLFGQLGNNSTTGSLVPVQVSGLTSGVQAVALGDLHGCALVNGGVVCWGDNTSGQLGNDTTASVNATPVSVFGLTSGVQSLSAGNGYACAVVNGSAQCWGNGANGNLGNASTANSSVPVHVQNLSVGVQAISAGGTAACAIVNGAAQCWGGNGSGVLGNNSTAGSSVPVQVQGLTSGVQALALGGNNFACAMVNGGLQCWGHNVYAELGNGSTASQSLVPAQVTGITGGLGAISVGDNVQCAIVNGGAQCWGSNYGGELGNNSTADSAVPVHVSGLTSGVQALSAGANGSACAVVNGGAWCWGYGYDGALGNNSSANSLVPVQVQGLSSGVQAITTGSTYACAIVNGGAWCWGYSLQGQIGNPSYEYSLVPVQVPGLTSGVQAISAGGEQACAIMNGGAWCWGNNNYGQLGNGSTASPNGPVQVSGLSSGVQAISSGAGQSDEAQVCAVVNGSVECWGFNNVGQLGNNTTTTSDVPVSFSGLSGAQTVGATGLLSCALIGGGVQCAGDILYLNYTKVAEPISGLTSGVQVLSVGGQETACAIVNTLVECWNASTYPTVVPPWAP